MTIPAWRLALTAGALVVLGAIGGGLVTAAAGSVASGADGVATGATTATGATAATRATADGDAALLDALAATGDPTSGAVNPAQLLALRDRLVARLGGLRQHLVHGTLTVLDRDGKPVTFQLDHGTVSTVGGGSITIAEAGGTSVSVVTSADTRVRVGQKPATLADLKVGDEVLVRSTVTGGTPTAKLVVVPPARPAAAAPAGGGNG